MNIRSVIIMVVFSAHVLAEKPKSELIKNGYYTSSDSELSEVFKTIRASDRVIGVSKNNLYSLGIFKIQNGKKIAYKFSLEEIETFLKNENNKDLLVLFLDKGIIPETKNESNKFIENIINQFKQFNYLRILIVGGAGSGIHVYSDASHNN